MTYRIISRMPFSRRKTAVVPTTSRRSSVTTSQTMRVLERGFTAARVMASLIFSMKFLAETGDDMSKFPTAGHFASWARVCPATTRAPGRKRKAVSVGKGNAWLRATLSQVAWAAVKTTGSYYGALYRRKKARGGPKKAIMAVQHALLVAIWHMFQTGCLHEDLGPDHFEPRDKERRGAVSGGADREDGCRGPSAGGGGLSPRRVCPRPIHLPKRQGDPAIGELRACC